MNYFTDITQAFLNKKKIRTQSYRGSLLVTTCMTTTEAFGTVDNNIIITPLSYAASVKSISMYCEKNIDARINVGMARVEGNDIVYISKNMFGYYTMDLQTSVKSSELLSLKFSTSTLYEHVYKYYKENDKLAEWEKCKNQKYGLLLFNTEIASTRNANASNNVVVEVQYVEGAPSDAPLITKIIK